MEVPFTLENDDYRRLGIYLSRKEPSLRGWVILGIGAACVLFVALSSLLEDAVWRAAAAVLLGASGTAALRWIGKKRPFQPSPVVVTFRPLLDQIVTIDPTGVMSRTKGGKAIRNWKWNRIEDVGEDEKSIFIVAGFGRAIVVPKRAFADADLAGAFLGEVLTWWRSARPPAS